VLAAINFNRQSGGRTVEIQYVVLDGMLFAKAKAVKLFAAKTTPKQLFGIGHILTQFTGCLQESWWNGSWRPVRLDWLALCVRQAPLLASPR
jgi:hypothetical protein